MIDTSILRERVLELALTGNLVDSNAGEGTAADFLALINDASPTCMSTTEDKKPFAIPENWAWRTLSQVADFHLGKTPSRSNKTYWNSSDYPWVCIADIPSDGHISHTKECVSRKASEDCFRGNISPAGTLVMSFKLSIGKAAILDIDAYHNEAIISIFPRYYTDDSFKLYLFWILPVIALRTKAREAIKGNTLNKKKLAALLIPIPPLEEQRRIVYKLEEVFSCMDIIDELQASLAANADTLSKKIVDAGISGALTKGWRFERRISKKDWTEHTIGACFDVVGGIQKKPDRAPKDNPIPYVTVANVFRNRIDLSDLRYFELFDGELERLQLKDKDILVVEGNGSGGEIGRCAMWENQIPVCVHQNHIIRLRCIDDQVLPEYVLLFLNSPTGKAVVRERAKTTTGLYNLSAGKIRSIPVPLPSLEEQKRIVERVEELLQALPA